MGTKARPKGSGPSVSVQIRLKPDERDRWKVAAADRGLSVADLVRELMAPLVDHATSLTD